MLPTRPLGTTGMNITPVGFGAWAVGGPWRFGWGGQSDDESVAAIRRALEAGVNWVDTAAVYGLGHSEQVVARALRGIPDDERPYVFTKCGLVWAGDDPAVAPARIGRPESIKREVEESLRRLEVERIDLYQMHWPAEDGSSLEDYWGALLELREAGKIRAAGLSNHHVAHLRIAEKLGHVDSLQPPLSGIHRGAYREIAWCADNNTGVVVYSPMQAGLLTGKFSRDHVRTLADDDWRKVHPDFTERLDANLQVADSFRMVAERHGVPIPAVAVAWTLAWRGVTGAIVGARRSEQVDDWLPAATLRLDEDDLKQIEHAITKSGAGEGPAHPASQTGPGGAPSPSATTVN